MIITHGFYRISSNTTPRDMRKMSQVAFAVNHDNWTIYISRSGHGALLREFNLNRDEFEGGWFFPRQKKLRFTSGHLGEVTKMKTDIEEALSAFIGVYFSEDREDLVPKCCGSTLHCQCRSTGSTPVGIAYVNSTSSDQFDALCYLFPQSSWLTVNRGTAPILSQMTALVGD